jgi:hypothetical protein
VRIERICNQIEIGDDTRGSKATVGIWISGYATEIGFFPYAVAETNNDVKALIGAARAPSGPGSLVPTRNRYSIGALSRKRGRVSGIG